MLIRYSVENFLSFNQRVVFSMIPGRGSLKNEHRSTPVEGEQNPSLMLRHSEYLLLFVKFDGIRLFRIIPCCITSTAD